MRKNSIFKYIKMDFCIILLSVPPQSSLLLLSELNFVLPISFMYISCKKLIQKKTVKNVYFSRSN